VFAPDLILSDLLLPGMSGTALCRAVRALPALAGVPFVLITTLADSDARAHGLEAGADDYLAKPIRERELLARVASLVRYRRVLVDLEARTEELQRTNEALEATREELVSAERRAAVGSLASGLAHEINNPLAYIKAGASALEGALVEVRSAAEALWALAPAAAAERLRVEVALEEARDIAAAMDEGSRRLERLASDLRAVSWPSADGAEHVDPAEAIGAAWTVARARFPALPRLDSELEPGEPLLASRALVTQALLAILEAAVVASGPGGRVSAVVKQIPGGVEISIQDSGASLSAELLARVFDPFFDRGRGTVSGLGLAVAAGIAQGLGGDVGASPGPAGGTVYQLRLPRRPGALQARAGHETGRTPQAPSPS
jgi:two-component system, NtrC family, sensor kinase